MNYVFTRPMVLQEYTRKGGQNFLRNLTVLAGAKYKKEYRFEDAEIAEFQARKVLVTDAEWEKMQKQKQARIEASKKKRIDNSVANAYKMIEAAGFKQVDKKKK